MFCVHFQRKLFFWLAFAGVVIPLAVPGLAAPIINAQKSYRITRWTVEDDMPQNRVTCLQQSHDGYLWVGTWSGLARFDGLRFTKFNKFNTPE